MLTQWLPQAGPLGQKRGGKPLLPSVLVGENEGLQYRDLRLQLQMEFSSIVFPDSTTYLSGTYINTILKAQFVV